MPTNTFEYARTCFLALKTTPSQVCVLLCRLKGNYNHQEKLIHMRMTVIVAHLDSLGAKLTGRMRLQHDGMPITAVCNDI
jgi:hypothetical protein